MQMINKNYKNKLSNNKLFSPFSHSRSPISPSVILQFQSFLTSDIPCFAEEVILHTDADLTGHEEISEGVGLNNIYEVALENEIYLEQGPSITSKYG